MPWKFPGLLFSASHCFPIWSPTSRPLCMGPVRSKAMRFFNPASTRIRAVATPPAPAPTITALISLISLRTTFKAFNTPSSLNKIALPSITGKLAPGPISPKPRTAVPSVTTATVFPFAVNLHTPSGLSAIYCETRPTPGVYTIDKSRRVSTRIRDSNAILPPECARKVGSSTYVTEIPA